MIGASANVTFPSGVDLCIIISFVYVFATNNALF